jgi:sulfoxide reductase heme-binding subunit YedZ
MELGFTALLTCDGLGLPMRDAPAGKVRSAGRLEAVFRAFGIVVVVLFASALAITLASGGGVPSHGGTMTMSSHGAGNMSGMAHAGTGAHGANASGMDNASALSHSGNASAMSGQVGGRNNLVFGQSFAAAALGTVVVALAALTVFAARRSRWMLWTRHVASAAAMLLLVVLYLAARGGLAYDPHNWNQSFADASVVLFAVTLAIGPLARLWHGARYALAWRRETGVWATVAAVMHVGIYLEGSIGWQNWRVFFYPEGAGGVATSLAGDRALGLVPTAFNVANVVGLVALAYALALAITSNDISQRWLKSGWSWLQERSTTMWLLVLVHLWIFAYYVMPAALPVGTLWASFWLVLLLQTAAFAKTVWMRHRLPATQASAPA